MAVVKNYTEVLNAAQTILFIVDVELSHFIFSWIHIQLDLYSIGLIFNRTHIQPMSSAFLKQLPSASHPQAAF